MWGIRRILHALRVRAFRLGAEGGGSSLIGFGLILPLLVALTAGIGEAIFVGFDYHRAGEATREAARLATILPPIGNLSTLSPATDVVCHKSGGTLNCGAAALEAPATFDAILAGVQQMLSFVAPDQLEIRYSYSGLGDASTPGGILPAITVRLVGIEHPFLMLDVVPGVPHSFAFPPFTTSQLAGGYKPAPAS